MTTENEFDGRFVRAYSQLVSAVWRDDAELARLLADPTGYATQAGLPVAEGSVVKVDRTQPETLFSKNEIVAEWTATPGVHVLRVPEIPLINVDELSEDELDAVSAGQMAVADNNVYALIIL